MGVTKSLILLFCIGFLLASQETKIESSNAESITFAKDIAPILNHNCVACHRADNIAPMSLRTYEEARPWAERMLEKIVSRQMPPWHAARTEIQFSNERRLSDEEIRKIVAWVDQGAMAGDPKDLPPSPTFSEAWQIGEPDAIFSMEKDYNLEADLTDHYLYFRIPTNFKEDRWVQAVEFRPGNRKVVHHAVAYIETPEHVAQEQRLNPSGSTASTVWSLLDTQLPSIELMDGTTRRIKPDAPIVNDGCSVRESEEIGGRNNSDVLSVYAPGREPDVWPPGTAKKIPAGSNIVLQMHYAKARGKVEKDRSSVALIFAKAPVQKMVGTRSIMNQLFAIPAGAENHEVTACWTYQRDVELISFMPHMHVRGKSMKYEVVYPNNKRQTLLDVPDYDFHWQTLYTLKKPLLIPSGSRIKVTAHFDNSERNMHNPDPTKVVRQGSATIDEMMIGFVNYVVPKPPDRVIVKVDPKIFESYVGQYEFDQNAIVTILKAGDKLFIEAGGQRVELLPISETTFVPDGRDSQLSFTKNEKSEVTGFITTQNDTLVRFKRELNLKKPRE
jgi:Copper type II ascorbate-dependent monooxygenase, C-terminal domain